MSPESTREDALLRLHQTLCDAGIPIHGLDADGNIHFKEEATLAQRSAAASLVKAFDWSAAEQAAARRRKYEALARLKAVKAEAAGAGDTEVAGQVEQEIAVVQAG